MIFRIIRTNLTKIRFPFASPIAVGPQNVPDQAEACQKAEAKQTHSTVDQNAHWKHYPVSWGPCFSRDAKWPLGLISVCFSPRFQVQR